MVNSSQTTNEAMAVASGGAGKQQREHRGGESSPESKQDCHNVVKSSGLGPKRGRFCCEHGHRTKSLKVSVACQTDDAAGGGGGNGTDSTKISSTTALDSAVFCNPMEPALSAATALRISAPQSSPKQDADDCSKSEGTLRLMIHNFRNMNDTVRGPAKVINNVPWKIMVMPRQHVVAKKGTQKCLGFFLQCFPESYSDSWSCQAAAELRLISQKPGVPNFVRKTNHVYTAKENDWGYSCFMTWADILDESQGYMKEENVILEVYVKAEAPKGILTHDQFCKKIQDYMRLADMQCSRNLIDKSLEVNQTALKFCKDKDENMKDELEKQRARLIEQKLKQSIERIEKGFTDVKAIENGETGTNLNTLRQALQGNLAAMKNAGSTGTKTASTTASSKDKTTAGTKQTKEASKTEDAKTGNVVTQHQSATEEMKINSDSTNDNSTDASKRANDGEQTKLHHMVDMDDPEAGTSDDSDDESDYEDIDEVCDSCLVEKLENMSCGGGIGIGVGTDSLTTVETQENGCQTEPPVAKPRLPPIGASLEESKKNQTANNNNTTTTPAAPVQPDNQIQPPKAQNQAKTISTTTTTTPVTLSNESEQKLLQLITEESKASLNTIKDTLERLVLLAQGGDTTLPQNVQFELGLKNATTPAAKANVVNAMGDVKTDIVEIPPPPSANANAKQQQQHLDENAKLVNLHNQLVAQKKRQEQLDNVLAEELDDTLLQNALQRQQQRQQQQFVQTDLSFTPRAGSPTEDRTLLARAQAIVENKAEELVTKYSQLIEQSEANRLAETVKKVEKRMKDIEKQTMTCRKELSDECERHYREEQKLIKANKQLKQQLDQANEKIEKLNNQLKDKRVEVKKLEKRLKAESQSSAENAELNSKIEQLERDLTASRQKHNEDKLRWNEETQKFQETKRSLQQELSFTTGEVERLHTQVEEKNASMRKLEASLKQERQQAQSSLKEAVERAKKAEGGLLELRLDIGLKGLQRAVDECQSHVAQLEDSAKRFTRMQMMEEAKTSNSCLQEWRKTKDKIQELIQKTKNDFGQQMDAIKSGKSLSSLPQLEVPRPPPPPATPKLFLSVQTPPEQRQQHIAPIGTAKGPGGAPAPTPQQPASSSSSQHVSNANVVPNGSTGVSHSNQRAPSVPPPTSVCNGPSNQGQTTPNAYHSSTMSNTTPQTPNASGSAPTVNQSTESPGGPASGPFEHLVFPQGATPQSSSSGNGPTPSSANMPPSPSVSTSRDKPFGEGNNSASSSSGVSDFTPWATDPLNIMHTLIGAKGGFNISGFDSAFSSANSVPASSASGTSACNASGQGGSHELLNGGFGMLTSGGQTTPSGRHSQDGQQGHWSSHSHHQQQQQQQQHHQHHWTQQSPQVRSSASNRSQGNGSPPQGYDNRSDSPIEKRMEALTDQLRNFFPNLSPDFIRDCVYEFRHFNKNFKTMPLDQLLHNIVGFVFSRQQQGPKMGNWNSGGMMGGYDSSHGSESTMGANDEACAICGYALRLQPMCSLPPCSHVFHSACAQQWLLGKRECPTCGTFTLPPEEYPDLS